MLREYEWYYEDRPHTSDFLKFDVLVTTYDTLIGDFDVISQIPFRVAVVDEAHRLRNQKGKLLECMREISATGTLAHGFQSRVLMSGTPLQNDLTELWTLLNFIEPFKFPDLDDFQRNFGNMANREQVESLQQLISPFMLRRVKEDVAKDIPAKEETVIDVELTSIQKQYYRAIFEHNHAFLSMGSTRQTAPKLMNIQMELRKVCNHPFLLDGVEHREAERQYREFLDSGEFDGKSPEEQQKLLNEHGYIMTSGKMVLLDKLLPKLKQEGHKILIFSQMVKMLDLISEYCEFRSYKYERLDGKVRGTERQKSIDRFEKDADSFLFLLSTRAGGVGINLTAAGKPSCAQPFLSDGNAHSLADICIIFDSDWNPQNDVQAQARCHRIGQTKDVRIYRLVTSRSFEQEMFDRASKKLGLEQAVLGTFEKDQEDDKPTQKEMEQLLKKGAYALLEDENDAITDEFVGDDIDAILAKRTRTRVVEGAKTSSWLNKQGMVVSKSKFTAEKGDKTLDMDDPEFWQKVMPDFVTPSILLKKLNDLSDEIDGVVRKGRGRGRWKNKKKDAAAEDTKETDAAATDPADDDENDPSSEKQDESEKPNKDDEGETSLLTSETLDDDGQDGDAEDEDKAKAALSRTSIRKVQKFMSDLKGMMAGIEDENDDLQGDEKDALQKLLLTISVKEKMFNEDQRWLAKKYLRDMEGGRRRRCRTGDQERFIPGTAEDEPTDNIPVELRIVGKKRRKRRKRDEIEADDEDAPKGEKRDTENGGGYVGEDGYLHHSDSDAEFSDVVEDLYQGGTKKKDRISRKEANRRRVWAAGDDKAAAAGRPWPVFPRHVVKKVLTTILDEVIEYDKEQGGVFSEPVPKDDFPEYYEVIKKPMDYSTMKAKLENGEYRSAQAMQKDFILILQNCREFNAASSDIVKEAREQHLMRPDILRRASAKHDLFLGEDGTVLEMFDDEKKVKSKKKSKKAKGDDDGGDSEAPPKKVRRRPSESTMPPDRVLTHLQKAKKSKKTSADGETEGESSAPRIRIKMKATKGKSKAKRKRTDDDVDDGAEADVDATPVPKKKKKKVAEPKAIVEEEVEDDAEENDAIAADDDSAFEAQAEVADADDGDQADTAMFDVKMWSKLRSKLKKKDIFDQARGNLTSFGPWTLPDGVAPEKFADIATKTIAEMGKEDIHSVFAEPVTDDDAPGYSEIVTNPIDFSTMQKKIDSGEYGSGSEAAKALYEDFLLLFDNCKLYNGDDGEVTIEAGRLLGLLPEVFVRRALAALD